MAIIEIIDWYSKNTNIDISEKFLKHLKELGIIENITLENVNPFLLEMFNNDYIKENGKYVVKENRLPIIEKYKDTQIQHQAPQKTLNENGFVSNIPKVEVVKKTEPKQKFKIESLGGKKLRLVKVK